ncbi:MAG: DUF2029 domain-containing protein [Luteitalea sp.]|nr:DUF2029 domain-containing protein [Luteitalea sp.]
MREQLGGPAATRPIRLLTALALLHAAIALNATRTVARHSGDFDRFWDITRSLGLPYRDYPVEYPPGTVALFELVGAIASRPESFRALLILTNAVSDAVIIGMLAWAWGVKAALFYAVAAVPILTLLFFRVDLWSVALTTTAVAAWQQYRPRTAAVAIAAGTAIKVWPLPFAVLLMARKPGRRWTIAIFGILALVTVVWWWVIAGDDGFVQVLTFRAARGWHIETIVGSLLLLTDPAAVRLESGALRIGSISEATAVAMLAAGMCFAVAALRAGAVRNAIGAGWLAGVVGLLLLSPLLSPQFLGWLLPGAAVAWVQGHRRSAGLVLLAVLMTIMYRVRMWAPGVVARDAVLLAVGCSAIVDLRRRPRPCASDENVSAVG